MSFQAVAWCKKQSCNLPLTKLVLVWLCEYADENYSCYPSQKHLAELCGCSDRSIRRSLHWLIENGLITVKHVKGTSNRYFVCMDTGDHPPLEAQVRTPRTTKSDNNKEDKKDISIAFEEWWVLYPRKVSKFKAKEAYAKSLKDLSHNLQLRVLMQCNIEWNKNDIKFVPHATTFLNQKRYLDYVEKNGKDYKIKQEKKKSKNYLAG